MKARVLIHYPDKSLEIDSPSHQEVAEEIKILNVLLDEARKLVHPPLKKLHLINKQPAAVSVSFLQKASVELKQGHACPTTEVFI